MFVIKKEKSYNQHWHVFFFLKESKGAATLFVEFQFRRREGGRKEGLIHGMLEWNQL